MPAALAAMDNKSIGGLKTVAKLEAVEGRNCEEGGRERETLVWVKITHLQLVEAECCQW